MTPLRARVGGLVFVLCGAVLAGIGVFLFTGVLHGNIPLDGAGASVVWLWVTGAVAGLTGGWMLVFARRPTWLLWLFVPLVVVFVVAGIAATLQSGGRLPRINL